jgi:hypothetical protein
MAREQGLQDHAQVLSKLQEAANELHATASEMEISEEVGLPDSGSSGEHSSSTLQEGQGTPSSGGPITSSGSFVVRRPRVAAALAEQEAAESEASEGSDGDNTGVPQAVSMAEVDESKSEYAISFSPNGEMLIKNPAPKMPRLMDSSVDAPVVNQDGYSQRVEALHGLSEQATAGIKKLADDLAYAENATSPDDPDDSELNALLAGTSAKESAHAEAQARLEALEADPNADPDALAAARAEVQAGLSAAAVAEQEDAAADAEAAEALANATAADPTPSTDYNELKKNPFTEVSLDAVEDECPATCNTCEAGVRKNGVLVCKTCKPTLGLEGMQDRVLVAGECLLCNLAFCGSCASEPKFPMPTEEDADKERLVCTQCLNGTTLVDGSCHPCPFKDCLGCGVRHAKRSEMTPAADGLIPREILTCTECKEGKFLVNGACEQCNTTGLSGCATCEVRRSRYTEAQLAHMEEQAAADASWINDLMSAERVKAATLQQQPSGSSLAMLQEFGASDMDIGEAPDAGADAGADGNHTDSTNRTILPSGDNTPADELVCASCKERQFFSDGGMSDEQFLVDGACRTCDFPHCNECVTDGLLLHCKSCTQPFMAIGSDDPEFQLNYHMEEQCQMCKEECLECHLRPHWCTKCDKTQGLAMAIRRYVPELGLTAATCLPVDPACKSSDMPAIEMPCEDGSPAQATIEPAHACTSCHEGKGILPLSANAKTGKCVPCHGSCKDCYRGADSDSCTACHEDDSLSVTDPVHLAGRCGAQTCPGCISREEAAETCGAQREFVPLVLGNVLSNDTGVCRSYGDDCTVHCVPDEMTGAVPERRVCTKFCHQKVTKSSPTGEKKLVVCKVKKEVQCGNSTSGDVDAALADAASGQEEVEQCQQQKSAECVTAVPFSEAANSMSATALMEFAEATLTIQAAEEAANAAAAAGGLEIVIDGGIGDPADDAADNLNNDAGYDGDGAPAPPPLEIGCGTLGGPLVALDVCQSSLLML